MRNLLLLLAILPMAAAWADGAYNWPGGARAAVSLAYDDALESQLDHAIPALDRHGLRGTFYLTLSSESVASRMDEWRAAAAHGHELANHAIFHPCSGGKPGRDWVSSNNDLDRMSVEEITQRVSTADVFLHAIDGKSKRTFTPPCIDSHAGGQPYWPAVRERFVAIKAVGGDGVTDDMARLDPYQVEVMFPADSTAEELISIVQQAAEQGTMANLTFHGVGGDHLAVSAEVHEALLKHLADNPDVYWVDTFLNIMEYVKAQ